LFQNIEEFSTEGVETQLNQLSSDALDGIILFTSATDGR